MCDAFRWPCSVFPVSWVALVNKWTLKFPSRVWSGLFCLHAEGRDCISVGPDEVNGYFGATLSLNGLNPACQPEYDPAEE